MATGETRIGNADYISSGAPTEDPGTGAFDGEVLRCHRQRNRRRSFFLNNAVSITYGDNDEVSLAFDNNGLNFVAGQNDDVYLAYDGPESVIDIGKGTAVDILANSGPLYLYDFQNDPTAEIILPPGTDTSPILFVGLQATGADMAVSATGAYTLQMFNGTTLVDLVQISEPGTTPPSFGLLPTGQGVDLTQGPLPGSLSVPLVYNLGAGETLSLNGNQLYGDAVILADSNVGDLDTETVNVTGTVTFSDMHVATDSLHFFGGTLDFTGVSNFGGNEFTTGYTVFNDNLVGTGTAECGRRQPRRWRDGDQWAQSRRD